MATEELSRTGEDLEEIEIQLLLEGIYRHYGFDFRGYAPGSLKRRLWRRADAREGETESAPQDRRVHHPAGVGRPLPRPSLNVPSVFPGPPFFPAVPPEGLAPPRAPPLLRH